MAEQATRYLITGGTGFIGSRLCRHLAATGADITVLSRAPERAVGLLPKGVRVVGSLDDLPDNAAIDVMINLAGKPLIGGRWTARFKAALLDSRIGTTRQLVAFIARLQRKPSVLLSASAIGYYGLQDDEELTEDDGAGSVFQAELCRAWESEARRAEAFGVRVCRMRFGVVMGPGGYLQAMLPSFRLGLGAVFGKGRNWLSWVHIDDLLGVVDHLVARTELSGAFNVTAPQPVRSKAFAAALAGALRRPLFLRIPRFVVAAALGEGDQLFYEGQRVRPKRLMDNGFAFRYPSVTQALNDLL